MTSKRKAPDENPLLNPTKRTKHENKPKSSKRAIPNGGEQQPSGLIIVRAPSAPPMNAQSSSRPPTSTSRTNAPAKSTRHASPPAASQPKASTSKVPHPKPSASQPGLSRSRDILSSPGDALAIENDVRAMDDESDEYRRQSRARSTIHSSFFSNGQPSSPKPRRAMSVDVTQPIPISESPVIERNKALRQGAMDAIRQSREEEVSQTPSGHRRRSSVGGRGNRIRVSIESTGTISQPHNSVAESSFHKHIPPELPDADRMRLLLSWCSTRANNVPPPEDEDNPFPTLTPKASALLRTVEDKMIRMLSDKQVDTRTSVPRENDVLPQRQNEQNESNRRFEVTYTEQIRSMEREDEDWKNSRRFYDTYFKKRQTLSEDAVHTPSAKAKGKQKATETGDDDNEWTPRHLSTWHHTALALAKSVMKPREDRDIQQGLQDLEFNVDMLNTHLNGARTLTCVAEEMLNARFANLAVEANLAPAPAPGSSLISAGARDTDPHDLLRALARVDRGRPPAKVGDAARRAMREIQRVEEKGIGAVGERRLTGVPPTPRTPRRGSTPGRDKA
ncbi:hypothetical protein BDZ89DRAFT_1057838 [Hymenopellis radicata]|nr:hypothetical protein BDZ89DRAFT_1057838 [Hymenopellis radicata]